MEDLLSTWHREANSILGLRKTGVMDGLLYKIVAQNEVSILYNH